MTSPFANPVWEFEDALGGDVPPIEGVVPNDLDQATQWVAKVANIRARLEEYRQAHRQAVARLDARLREVTDALETQEEWLLDALEMYHRTVLVNDPERLTIPTPAGTLKSNKGQPKWIYEDEAAFEAWCMSNVPTAVVPHPDTINKTKAKTALKDATISDGVVILDGEKVPGVKVIPAERTFKVVLDADKE